MKVKIMSFGDLDDLLRDLVGDSSSSHQSAQDSSTAHVLKQVFVAGRQEAFSKLLKGFISRKVPTCISHCLCQMGHPCPSILCCDTL